jgi:hypothetical protein
MIPASEVFPNNSGGFITTDMENITYNPNIIDDILSQIDKLNAYPSVFGQWTFILPHNWIYNLRKCIVDVASAQRVQDAVIAITLALGQDRIQIMKLWCAEVEEMDHVEYMDRVAHEKYKTHQYFVYVDNINSVHLSKYLNSIDFVQSSKIYSTFA